jgi:hypothetical protein
MTTARCDPAELDRPGRRRAGRTRTRIPAPRLFRGGRNGICCRRVPAYVYIAAVAVSLTEEEFLEGCCELLL